MTAAYEPSPTFRTADAWLSGRPYLPVSAKVRRPFPDDLVGFIRARPGWHRHGHRPQRAILRRPELELRPRGDRQARPRYQRHRLLPGAVAAPHLTAPAQDVPDLLHMMMGHRPGDPAGSQLKVRHT